MSTIKDTLTDVVKIAMKARELEKVKVLRSLRRIGGTGRFPCRQTPHSLEKCERAPINIRHFPKI